MESAKYKFLQAVLGSLGANALMKAGDRVPELEPVFVPRTIVSWISSIPEDEFEGPIPGNRNSYCHFVKSEDRYSGSVAIGDEVYSFENASMLHLGACVAVAIGADSQAISIEDVDVEKLGKNIDALVKARYNVAELSKKVLDPGLGYTFSHEHHDLGDGEMLTHVKAHAPGGAVVGEALFNHHPSGTIVPEGVKVHADHQRQGIASAIYGHAQKVTGKPVAPSHDQTPAGQALWSGNKAQQQFGKSQRPPHLGHEAPGPAAAPRPPIEPEQPVPQDPTQNSKGPTVGVVPRQPKPPPPSHPSIATAQAKPGAQPKPAVQLPGTKPKQPALKVTKSEASNVCEICSSSQFEGDTFVGCLCFKSMAQSVKTQATDTGYNLSFGSDWDKDSILTLIESFGRNTYE